MNRIPALPPVLTLAQLLREEAACWALGLGFTMVLFAGLARVETVDRSPPAPEISELRVITLPLEPPPPDTRPVELTSTPVELPPLSGIEVGVSDSPIKIAVAPPDPQALISEPTVPPRALVSLGRLSSDYKPQVQLQMDSNRIFHQGEVDQRPQAVVRVPPPILQSMLGNATRMGVRLWILIDAQGQPESVKVAVSSGIRVFDSLVMETVKEQWQFSPAVRRGKKVRCLVEQQIWIKFEGGSPFGL